MKGVENPTSSECYDKGLLHNSICLKTVSSTTAFLRTADCIPYPINLRTTSLYPLNAQKVVQLTCYCSSSPLIQLVQSSTLKVVNVSIPQRQ